MWLRELALSGHVGIGQIVAEAGDGLVWRARALKGMCDSVENHP